MHSKQIAQFETAELCLLYLSPPGVRELLQGACGGGAAPSPAAVAIPAIEDVPGDEAALPAVLPDPSAAVSMLSSHHEG